MMSSAGSETGADVAAAGSPLQHALSSQGVLLGQHDTLLCNLADRNQALVTQVTHLTAQVTQLSTQVSQLSTQVTQLSGPTQPAASSSLRHDNAAISPVVREPHVSLPERYSGDLGSCQAFLTQVSLIFRLQPLSFASEQSKVAFLIGLLAGTAREWGTSVWEQQSPICDSYPAFTAEMKKVFDHPVRGREASHRLTSLRQGSRSVAEYAVEFRTLAAGSGWNDKALQGIFYAGLTEGMKDELATKDESPSFDKLVDLAINLDNRVRERRRERSSRSELVRAAVPHRPASTSQRPSLPEPEPMQLGRALLSSQEKQARRDANACLYCGKTGHYLASCSLRLGKAEAQP